MGATRHQCCGSEFHESPGFIEDAFAADGSRHLRAEFHAGPLIVPFGDVHDDAVRVFHFERHCRRLRRIVTFLPVQPFLDDLETEFLTAARGGVHVGDAHADV